MRHFLYDSPNVHYQPCTTCVEVPRPSRTCSVSRRELRPNELFYSVVSGDCERYIRKDIAADHWTAPPKDCVGWWKSTVKHIRESDVPEDAETPQSLFARLLTQPGEPDTLYIVTLLLLRRKQLRYERELTDEQGNRLLEVYSPETNTLYQIPIALPDQDRLEEIQCQLSALKK